MPGFEFEVTVGDDHYKSTLDGPYSEEAANQLRTAHEKLEEKAKMIPALDYNDPIDAVLIDMIKMNRKKRQDYALDSDIFSNFRDVASMAGIPEVGPREVAYILLLVKVARLRSLRENGRMEDPNNESVLDTFLDLAVYSTITLALTKENVEHYD